jgi:hypothetical protein
MGRKRKKRTLRTLESTSKKTGVLGVVQRDPTVAVESKVEEVEVLREDGRGGTRKVERKAVKKNGKEVRLTSGCRGTFRRRQETHLNSTEPR